MRQFYRAFPIRYTLSSELSWSHYQQNMRLDLPGARAFYVGEAAASNWGVRELKRQIDTHLYERLLHTQEAELLDGATDAERALTVLHDLGGIKGAETGLAMSRAEFEERLERELQKAQDESADEGRTLPEPDVSDE